MGVLDALLEGFNPGEPRDWHGRFRAGDMVRLKIKTASGDPVVGRIQRFTDDGSKVIVAPVAGGGPHVEAGPSDIAFHSPKEATAHLRRQMADPAQAYPEAQRSGAVIPSGKDDPNLARRRQAREGGATVQISVSGSSRQRGLDQVERERQQRVPRPRVRESALDVVLEGFTVPASGPAETPAQSQARGAAQVASADKSLRAGWSSGKHPRGRGGKFAYTTGGKRATRGHHARSSSSSSSSTAPRLLNSGSRGALVQSIQRTLNVPSDGIYGPQTKAAVARYQRQHGLQVDGVVGAQTLASMRGATNARLVKPGPIPSKAARLTHPRAKKAKAPVVNRIGGGVLV